MGPEARGSQLTGEGSVRSGRERRGEVLGEAQAPRTVEECPEGQKAGGRREGRPRRSDGVEVGELSAVRTWEARSQGNQTQACEGDGSERVGMCYKFRICQKVC